MTKKNHNPIKYACYMTNVSMSIVATLSPLLFLTFRNLYNISFSMLGALVLINFCTQLIVDLILSFYSHKFNLTNMVKITPVLTALGLFIYAIIPLMFPDIAYIGLAIGT
ncbi:MAG TPA: MFS transporter, partial [Bacillota bacterium]|nr:MFS transporter [Bacillota bacterium]